ncbi:MAG: 2-dehydropantoate 2-reductase [Euryarchaeota archaeon]|nr:2-dehydropantoate 2-reductase [Euryarchaeota archaeon]
MGPVVIVGAGAIGLWSAARLAPVTEVWLLTRPSRLLGLEGGIRLETLPDADPDGQGGDTTVPPERFRAVGDPADLPTEPDLILVATRAYQTRDAVEALKEAGIRPRIAMTLQNGLGNAEALAAAFGAERVVVGTTTHGVTLLGPDHARHAGAGDTRVGPWVPAAAEATRKIAALLDAAGVPTEVVDDPRRMLWLKVAVNAAINPPTAIHRIENGVLLDGGPLEADLRAAAREVADVAQAEGVDLAPEEAEAAAVSVARRTARNRSSMLQALLAGRPLETDAITGEVVRRAARHGIDVPINRRLLSELEMSMRSRGH